MDSLTYAYTPEQESTRNLWQGLNLRVCKPCLYTFTCTYIHYIYIYVYICIHVYIGIYKNQILNPKKTIFTKDSERIFCVGIKILTLKGVETMLQWPTCTWDSNTHENTSEPGHRNLWDTCLRDKIRRNNCTHVHLRVHVHTHTCIYI